MITDCFIQESTVVDSTRIILAPRVKAAIVESTFADRDGKQIVSSRNQPWLIQPEFYSHPELKQS